MIDKRFIVLGLIFVITLALSLGFSNNEISEKAYGELLGKSAMFSSFDPHALQVIATVAAFLSSAILFFYLCGWGKEYEEKNLLPSAFISIILLLTPFVAQNIALVDSPSEIISLPLFVLGAAILFSEGSKKWLGIIPLIVGLALTYQYIQLQTIDETIVSGFPIIIAIAFLGVGYYLSGERKSINSELIALVAGIITLFLLTPLSLAFFAVAAGMSMKKFMEEHGKIVLLVAVFALVLFATLGVTAPLTAVISAASLTVFAYILLSLYNFEATGIVPYIMIALVAFSLATVYFDSVGNPLAVADRHFVESLKYANANGMSISILDYPNTYQYYMKKPAVLVSGDSLVSQESANYEYILLAYKTLPHNLAKYPIAFLHYGTATNKDGTTTEIFYSERYAMTITPNAEGKISADGTLYGLNGGFVKTIPFTKLKMLNNGTLNDPNSIVINIDGYEDSQLYGLLMAGEIIYKNDGARIIKVK